MEIPATTLANGFVFPEGPRWHDGQLWFADQHDCMVHVLNPDGSRAESFEVAGRPSGMEIGRASCRERVCAIV